MYVDNLCCLHTTSHVTASPLTCVLKRSVTNVPPLPMTYVTGLAQSVPNGRALRDAGPSPSAHKDFEGLCQGSPSAG